MTAADRVWLVMAEALLLVTAAVELTRNEPRPTVIAFLVIVYVIIGPSLREMMRR